MPLGPISRTRGVDPVWGTTATPEQQALGRGTSVRRTPCVGRVAVRAARGPWVGRSAGATRNRSEFGVHWLFCWDVSTPTATATVFGRGCFLRLVMLVSTEILGRSQHW